MNLVSLIDSMSIDDRIYCHNIYCEHNNLFDDKIYFMDDFNELVADCFEPLKLCFMTHYGNFNPHDDYWAFDGSGNFVSFATMHDVLTYCETAEELAEDIEKHGADYDPWVYPYEEEEEEA